MKTVVGLPEYILDRENWKQYQQGSCNHRQIYALAALIPLIFQQELTKKQRCCMELKYYEDLSQREIAMRLNLEEQVVSKRIQRGEQTLRRYLQYPLALVQRLNHAGEEEE